MNNIRSGAEVLQWAHTIADGKGEKFTPLSKGDMYAIANYILDITGELCRLKTDTPETVKTDTPQAETRVEPETRDDAPPPHITPVEPQERKIEMSMGCALHLQRIDAQKAYDKFLEAMKDHPKDKMVMDFSTGQASSFAAFSYWLTSPVTVSITGGDNGKAE